MQIPPITIDEVKASKLRLYGNTANDFVPGNYAVKMYRNDYPLYFARSFSGPTIRLSSVPVATTYGLDYKVPGEKPEFDDFVLSYRMDEYWEVWNYHYEWLTQISHYDFRNEPFNSINTISVTLLTNKQNPFQTFKFSGSFPVEIGAYELASQEDQPILMLDVRYAFLDLVIEKHKV